MDTRKGCYGSSQWFLVSLAAKCRPNIRVFCVLKRDEWMMLIRKKWSYRQGPVEICFSFFSFDISWVFTCWFPWCSFPFVPPCLLHVPLLICHVCSPFLGRNQQKLRQTKAKTNTINEKNIFSIFQSLDSPVFPNVKREEWEDNRMGRIHRSTTDFDDVATAVAARFTGNLDPSKLSAGFAGMNLDAIWWPLEDFGDGCGSFIFSFIFFRQE